MAYNIIFVILVIASTSYAYRIDNCNRGPEYWCKTWATAVECKAGDYCKYDIVERRLKYFENLANAPVRIGLYYESLCPGCRDFIESQLYPTYQKLLSSGIFAIDLYPYGNADEQRAGNKWNFTCQHGPNECVINLVETCALHILANTTVKIPFIHCVETNPTITNGRACAVKFAVDWKSLEACAKGAEGNYLEHLMALKTSALNPPHQYVPWITLNGVHTDAIQDEATDDLLKLVCDTYTGPLKPEQCSGSGENGVRKINRCIK